MEATRAIRALATVHQFLVLCLHVEGYVSLASQSSFPAAGSDALIRLARIERAQERWRDYTDQVKEGLVALPCQ